MEQNRRNLIVADTMRAVRGELKTRTIDELCADLRDFAGGLDRQETGGKKRAAKKAAAKKGAASK